MDGFTTFKDRIDAGQRLANQLIHYQMIQMRWCLHYHAAVLSESIRWNYLF